MSRQIKDENGQKQFDTTVHVRNAKGKVVDEKPYHLFVEGGKRYYKCLKSGKFYHANGDEMADPTQVPAPVAAVAPVVSPSAAFDDAAEPTPAPKGRPGRPRTAAKEAAESIAANEASA